MIKKIVILTTLLFTSILVKAQGPIYLWGSGLDGSLYQQAAIGADGQNGLFFEAPLTPAGVRLPIEFNWRGGGNPALKILANGNVGVGVSNAQSKFDVAGQVSSYFVGIGQTDGTTSTKNYANFGSNNHGSVLISSNLYFSGNDHLKIANTHAAMSGASILIPGNSMPNQGGIAFYTNQVAAVKADDSYTGKMAMLIKSDGNVGIGTDKPDSKLSVKGNIRAKEIKVEVDNWPDYVFKKEYSVPSLKEIEKHIQEKGHLPGIPSAREVKEKGIDLGEMNSKLLEKIEELTLHLISKDKEITELKKLNRKVEDLDHMMKEILERSKKQQ